MRTGRGGFQQSYGPPSAVLGRQISVGDMALTDWLDLEMGAFVHACEGEMVCESLTSKLPYFNAPIYLENKASA